MADERKLCFIVGPIGENGSGERKLADWLLKGIFKPVLEDENLNYRVKRADEDADPGSITSALITDLIDADLVVADLTGFNANAFYELGIRHAMQKPTIHVIAEAVNLPFDNKDQRTIFIDIGDIDSVERGKRQLREAAAAVIAEGYQVRNPVTQANAVNALKASSDPTAQLIGDMEERLSRLERRETAVQSRQVISPTPLPSANILQTLVGRLDENAVDKASLYKVLAASSLAERDSLSPAQRHKLQNFLDEAVVDKFVISGLIDREMSKLTPAEQSSVAAILSDAAATGAARRGEEAKKD